MTKFGICLKKSSTDRSDKNPYKTDEKGIVNIRYNIYESKNTAKKSMSSLNEYDNTNNTSTSVSDVKHNKNKRWSFYCKNE